VRIAAPWSMLRVIRSAWLLSHKLLEDLEELRHAHLVPGTRGAHPHGEERHAGRQLRRHRHLVLTQPRLPAPCPLTIELRRETSSSMAASRSAASSSASSACRSAYSPKNAWWPTVVIPMDTE